MAWSAAPSSSRRRGLRTAAAATLVLLALVTAYLLVRGLAVRSALERARADLATTRSQLGQGDLSEARRSLAQARRETARARSASSDPVWTVAGAIPVLGAAPHAVTTVAATIDDVVTQTMPDLLTAADAVSGQTLRTTTGGVDLTKLEATRPTLDRATMQLATAERRLDGIGGPLPGPVRRAVTQARAEVRSLATATQDARTLAEVMPSLLGQRQPKRYLLVIQNPAEARGTGGILAAYGVIDARDGRISLLRLGRNSDLADQSRVPIDLGPDFTALYGDDPAWWVNANLSPHFPYASRIWLALWERQHHEALDGVVSIDPVLVGYLLRATAPVRLTDGSTVGADQAANFVMRDAYARFPKNGQDAQRDAYLIDFGRRAIRAVLGPGADPRTILAATRQGLAERRLLVYSTDPASERTLESTPAGGSVPDTAAPFAAVVINNGGGNKLDYYLDRSVNYRSTSCSRAGHATALRMTFTNTAPAHGLSEWVAGNTEAPARGTRPPPGTDRLLVYAFTTRGAQLSGATLDGRPLLLHEGAERGHRVLTFQVDLAPGQARTAEIDLMEPRRPEAPTVLLPPLAREARTVIAWTPCAS